MLNATHGNKTSGIMIGEKIIPNPNKKDAVKSNDFAGSCLLNFSKLDRAPIKKRCAISIDVKLNDSIVTKNKRYIKPGK